MQKEIRKDFIESQGDEQSLISHWQREANKYLQALLQFQKFQIVKWFDS